MTRYNQKLSCREQNRMAAANPNWKSSDVDVVVFLWNPLMMDLLRRHMDEIRTLAPGATFVLVGPIAQELSGVDLLHRSAYGNMNHPAPFALFRVRAALAFLRRRRHPVPSLAIRARPDVVLELLMRQMPDLRSRAPNERLVLVGPKVQEISGINLLNHIARDDAPPKLDEYPYFVAPLSR